MKIIKQFQVLRIISLIFDKQVVAFMILVISMFCHCPFIPSQNPPQSGVSVFISPTTIFFLVIKFTSVRMILLHKVFAIKFQKGCSNKGRIFLLVGILLSNLNDIQQNSTLCYSMRYFIKREIDW